MSGCRRCCLDNAIFILAIFSIATLTVCTARKSSPQGHLKVAEVTDETRVRRDGEEAAGTASDDWHDDVLVRRRRRSAGEESTSVGGRPPTMTGPEARKRGKLIDAETRRRRRSSAYEPRLSWLPQRSVPIDAGQDATSWPDSRLAVLRRASPFYKRGDDSRRRRLDQEQDGQPADQNANGWADNNVRIWG